MEKKRKKYVVIIQCELARNRCSGFACTESFYNRENLFRDYDENIRYIAVTCGGCCGKAISGKLEHFAKKCNKNTDIKKNEVVIHLSSCMVTDNHHSDRCPHLKAIKEIIDKKGYKNVIEGSFVSATAEKKRKKGIYQVYE